MNNLNNAYGLSQEVRESTGKLQSPENDLKGIKRSQDVFTVSTYFIYFSFTSVIFAGVTVWNLQDYIFGNYTNVIGMVWALVTVFVVPLALSLAKHFNYKAIARHSVEHDRNKVIIHSIIVLALLSGLYYEAISSSSNLQAKAFHAVENSKAGESILNTSVASSSSGAIAGLIADAEFKLAGCERRLKDGSVKDCNNSTAKVNSLKAQAQAERESVATANVAAIGAKQDALSKERAEHALPAAKYVAEMAGRSNDYGTMVVVILAALFFELIHISTIFNEAKALRGIDTQTARLKALNSDYFRATGKTFDEGDFKDSRTIDLSDNPLNVPMDNDGADFEVRTKGKPYKDNHDFGFIPSSANARFKWQDSEVELPAKPEKSFGFIPSRSSDSLAAQNRKDYPQEIVMPTKSRPTHDDYAPVKRVDLTARERLRNGEKLYPSGALDAPDSPAKADDDTHENTLHAHVDMHVDMRSNKHQKGVCPQCGERFKPVNKQHRFCSPSCRDTWHNAKKPERVKFIRSKKGGE